MNNKEILKQAINNIENDNYICEYRNGGYYYSKEITNIFMILNDETIKKIFDDNIEKYTFDLKKKLDQEMEPESFSLEECIIYFNWLWHLEAGRAVGIVSKRIKEGKYLRALKRFYEVI